MKQNAMKIGNSVILPFPVSDEKLLPNDCPNGCGELFLRHVCTTFKENKEIVTVGCKKCGTLFDSINGVIDRIITQNFAARAASPKEEQSDD